MSTINQLQVRDLATCAQTDCESVAISLAEARVGQHLTVVSLCQNADQASARRLFDLGFVPGQQVELRRRAPLGDPLIFRVMGYEIALRSDQARCIRAAAL